MKPKHEPSTLPHEAPLPPSCRGAATYVAEARRIYLTFERECGWLREDVVGCLIVGAFSFRGDYVPRDRGPTEEEWRIAGCCVFRDFWKHAKDLLLLAGWWPSLEVPDELGTAFRRFLAWQETHFEAALRWARDPNAPDRVKRTRSIWNFLVRSAEQAGRVDVDALRNDVRKTLSEAGLRGADGRDPLTDEELRAETSLIERAADQAGKSTIYYDRRGRGRISWRTCRDLHPNRGQRMPEAAQRKLLGNVLHHRGSLVPEEGVDQTELDRSLIAAEDLRQMQAEVATIQQQRDLELDLERLLEMLRPLVRARGPAAEAALAYLQPRVLHRGTKVSRREACSLFTPPVSQDALRHQESWLRPRLGRIAATLGFV